MAVARRGAGGCVCVFRQKKADEVRISDWTSDVCSSDLGSRCSAHAAGLNDVARGAAAVVAILRPARSRDVHNPSLSRAGPSSESDRQSVVKGTSVSVRVDLGGRPLTQTTKPHPPPPMTHK